MSVPGPAALTFLFTDIEGSTQLWEQHPDAMRGALALHDALLHETIQRHHGRVIKTTGDGVHAVFGDAADAVSAVIEAQRALRTEDGGRETDAVKAEVPTPVSGHLSPVPLRVRMGLHSGPAEERGGDYYGSTLNRAARLMAIAHGGQVLLSESTAGLARDGLPGDAALRDMGEHRLKDLVRTEHVYQLVVPDLRADFPPLRSLGAFPNNLPVQLTSFVGREREMVEARRLLGATHLLTLTGPGGTGKTRLGLHIAADMLEQFADGVWLIELAPLADPALIPQTIANVLGVHEQPTRSLNAVLRDFFRDKQMLLILDNCEHVIEASAQLASELLHTSPQLRILASSREPLGIAGETIFRVPPLGVPPSGGTLELIQYEAVRLFVERAQAARADFALSGANADAVAQICARLDGIPLALELAAARVRSLSVDEIASRLDNQFRLLTGGSRTALPRQQTLRALIDWSYNLLSDAERVLFRRLAVFAGGWTLEAAEQVTTEDGGRGTEGRRVPPSPVLRPEDVLDLLDSLVNKSLVLAEPRAGGTRYRFLETIRQYARDKLMEAGESEPLRDRHVNYFESIATEASALMRLGEPSTFSEQIGPEIDNIRVALDWSLAHQPLSTLRILGSLIMLWNIRGEFTEGQRWCELALARTEGESGPEFAHARAQAYTALTSLAVAHGDSVTARRASEEGIRLYRELGRPPEMSMAMVFAILAASFSGEPESAAAYFAEGLELAQASHDKFVQMMLYGTMTRGASYAGDYTAAKAYIDQSAQLAREIGSRFGLGTALMGSAMLAIAQHDFPTARAQLEESYALFTAIDHRHFQNVVRSELANVARLLGENERAVRLYREVIAVWKRQGHRAGITRCLECVAFIASTQQQNRRAARLLGAAEALRAQLHAPMTPEERDEYAEQVAALRARGTESEISTDWVAGRGLSMDEAIALAMSDD